MEKKIGKVSASKRGRKSDGRTQIEPKGDKERWKYDRGDLQQAELRTSTHHHHTTQIHTCRSMGHLTGWDYSIGLR